MALFRIALIALFGIQLYGCAMTNSGATAAHDRRTTGALVEDQAIEMKAFARIAEHAKLAKPENAHINAVSFNGVLLLTGETRTAELRRLAGQYVSDIPKVRKVYNEIRVMEPARIGARTRDSWTTTKVKAKLLANESIDGTRIKVVTESGTVYLMGIVTRRDADLATSIASDTSGLSRIVRAFEYLD